MNADPSAQLRLLDLQALDSNLDRLAHRRDALPELAQIAAAQERLAAVRDEVVMAETEDRDLGRDQAKVEAEVDMVRQRAARDQQRLDAGQVTSPRELENLQHEIASLARRQGDLEDSVLEVMEQREAAQSRLTAATDERDRLTAQIASLEQARDTSFAEIEAEAAAVGAERAQTAASLPDDLVALYEKVRAGNGGVGAAKLFRGRCEGCHLQLNTVDINALRAAPDDQVLRCEECRRILVRTPDSGL